MIVDYLVVGSGLTGATIARMLADAGREVLVVERRPHIGGNVYDHAHASGVRIHTYGPHCFHTNSQRVWGFANRFSTFYPFAAVVKSYVDKKYENWPVAGSYIRRAVGDNWEPAFTGTPANFEEAALALMPQTIYDKFVKGYTEKQWGVPAHTLSPSLAKRFDVREDDDPRLWQDSLQGIPDKGYAEMMRNMLAGIPVILNCDYLKNREAIKARRMLVFTGPIDEFFGFDLGRLRYRGQRREHLYLPDIDSVQPSYQVNNPNSRNGLHVRTVEWKQIMQDHYAERIQGTVLTTETPFSPTDPNEYEYPFPDGANALLCRRYQERARAIPGLLVCGRLGEYRYFYMDQAVERAMELAGNLLEDCK